MVCYFYKKWITSCIVFITFFYIMFALADVVIIVWNCEEYFYTLLYVLCLLLRLLNHSILVISCRTSLRKKERKKTIYFALKPRKIYKHSTCEKIITIGKYLQKTIKHQTTNHGIIFSTAKYHFLSCQQGWDQKIRRDYWD